VATVDPGAVVVRVPKPQPGNDARHRARREQAEHEARGRNSEESRRP
jgi:hypothetical protein